MNIVFSHEDYMRVALRLAKRHLGQTAPNPTVGCVIVKDDVIVGMGVTAKQGRPHAETEALLQAGHQAKDAVLYVTLEPCVHIGRTGSCAEAIIKAGIKKCIIACRDPFKKVNGLGIQILEAAGIQVLTSVLEKEALDLNKGFFLKITQNRPFITLKSAVSVDGKIAFAPYEKRKKLTDDNAHRRSHLLRVQHDAIAVGVGTMLADNPSLDCRLEGLADASPDVVIFDRHLRVPLSSQIFQKKIKRRIFIFHAQGCDVEKCKDVTKVTGAVLAPFADDMSKALGFLCDYGITRLLVEGGAELFTSFLRQAFYDEIAVFSASLIIGNRGQSCVGDLIDYHNLETIIKEENGLTLYRKINEL